MPASATALPAFGTPLRLGPHELANRVFTAPMAGVTDLPWRRLARRLGAGHCVSEMVASRTELRASRKTALRMNHDGEPGPVAAQLVGVDPAEMAAAAQANVEAGARIIDINMGCPAKKVCNRWAGSALMQDEELAVRIVDAVVRAMQPLGVPVTLKMRTGWCHEQRNAPRLAHAAQEAGVALVAVHGRSREQGYGGEAEYETIAAIKASLRIPVVANGDIDTVAKARAVLAATGADAIMIGRAALGRPWLPGHMARALADGVEPAPPTPARQGQWLLEHLRAHHAHYGHAGVGSARKHVGWAVAALPGGAGFRAHFNTLTEPQAQLDAVAEYFDRVADAGPGDTAP
ncbi:MAG: tRNA dihydrouridine synthase DusB [Betaproteobacteria bacterium]|nr:tRNA dihydrouridine synthase DusB [Betaproteobacteria bacterium]MDE1955311.1 tRNA dihydrouridine synthase DusB [Betaproteobacteria bacterium]